MHKIRFSNTITGGNGSWDGTTLVTTAPTFAFRNGFEEAKLPNVAGRIPADIFGKAPGGDAYLLIASMWTSRNPLTTDLLGVDTNAPVQPRDRWVAFPGNTHISLVRPQDTLTFAQTTTGDAWLELLLEPLANTNEFGDILIDYARQVAEQRQRVEAESEFAITGNFTLSNWAGVTRIVSTAGAGNVISLPSASAQRLRDVLIVERDGAGALQLVAPGGQLINGQASITMTTNQRSISVRGSGTRYSATSIA